MKVLFTEHVEHYTVGLSRELCKYVDLYVLGTHKSATVPKQIILPNVPKIRGLFRILSLRMLPRFFEVIHANDSQSGLNTGASCKLLVTEHGWPEPEIEHASTRSYYVKERDALLRLHEIGIPIVTISNYSAGMLRRKFGIKVREVVYHGLLDEFREVEPKELAEDNVPTILWSSRFIPMKEPFVLLEALRILDRKLDFKVFLRGEGPLRKRIEEFIEENRLTHKIIFKAKVPFQRLPDLYNSSTILVHTSSSEPFGLCVLEGIGAGLPVVVPEAGGAYEVAGPAAVSFVPHNPEDLAEKITFLLSSPESYYKQSRKSLERSRCFTWAKAAKEYLRIYERIARS